MDRVKLNDSIFPPERGISVACCPKGVHLILLYFIRISLLSAETFFLFGGWWMVGGWWMTTFWFFKSLDINMIDTLGVYVYI